MVLTLFAWHQGFGEANPFMLRFLSKPGELLLVKVVAPPFIVWLVPAKLLLPSIGFMLAVIGWNIAGLLEAVAKFCFGEVQSGAKPLLVGVWGCPPDSLLPPLP